MVPLQPVVRHDFLYNKFPRVKNEKHARIYVYLLRFLPLRRGPVDGRATTEGVTRHEIPRCFRN